ncbi:MAG TPA: hypothetical protein VK904_02180, partial [Miltoncostaeaceae bacterium]|nr:hypothetical protein [Miltoncostaeaceae bacterium]
MPERARLLEREREIAALGDALAGARAGRGGAVLVEAPAGFGKTSLPRGDRDRRGRGRPLPARPRRGARARLRLRLRAPAAGAHAADRELALMLEAELAAHSQEAGRE